MKNDKFDRTKSNAEGDQNKRVSSLQQIRTCFCVSSKRWLPDTMNITTIISLHERENTKKENLKYNFLKHIRNSPMKVEIQDMETGEIVVYSSMYKAAKRFNQQSRLISTYDGNV